ncbi:hypothetical protein K437DRAFT_255363 [Tilletiaria anomala UBC 951]|uniref:CoA-dependent acyltransferase n=1 Tax=Tilletiaria anomala (strain ATCC 24038 / CBS 436.72 / UBC 951) TaxID=1037660 RepID=A0A066WDQ4_TILAU|nr:uncharacterized protein K437DRAFT_255363 [Tilletiaria anomala UBC 951]KDN49234.1 hypothetical protein K437DRAFT_255363 [Tilletiaria anomala UBC 951]
MTQRSLSLHERLGLSIAQSGEPSTVVMTGYLSCSPSAALAFIQPRVGDMLQRFPLLSCAANAILTRKPEFKKSAQVISPIDIFKIISEPAHNATDATKWALAMGKTFNVTVAPLWSVGILPSSTSKDDCFVALAINHIISDGRSTLQLFASLFTDLPGKMSVDNSDRLPPRCEDTISHRPRLPLLMRTLIDELLIPKLPRALGRILTKRPAWPAHRPLAKQPIDCPEDVIVIECDEGTVDGLKALAAKVGTRTIHAPLHTACVAALLIVIEADEDGSANGKQNDRGPEILTGTPMSLRDPALGHPIMTGNYVASANWHKSSRSICSTKVYYLTRKYHHLVNPADRRGAAGYMGLLAFIPDSKRNIKKRRFHDRIFTRNAANGLVKPSPTGWEDFVRDKARSNSPYLDSLCLSNLGLLPAQTDVLRQVWFAQSAVAAGWSAGMMVSVVGLKVTHEDPALAGTKSTAVRGSCAADEDSVMTKTGEMTHVTAKATGHTTTKIGLTVSWRDGAVTGAESHLFSAALSAALLCLATQDVCEKSITEETTFAELCERVKQALAVRGK